MAALVLLAGLLPGVSPARTVDANSLTGKVLVGYQTWFRCPGDGSESNSFDHWTNDRLAPTASNVVVDNYPDTADYPQDELCPTPALTVGGKPGAVFSSFRPGTAMTHFKWMHDYDIDGALIARFICCVEQSRRDNDTPERNIMAAAEANGRVFAIDYDLTGNYDPYTDEQALAIIEGDWLHLVNDLKITQSPAYLKQDGRPLVGLWGLGFNDSGHLRRPALAQKIIDWFHNTQHAVILGGVGWNWTDPVAKGQPDWTSVYASMDIIHPWTVGAYSSLGDVDGWKNYRLVPDMARVAQNGHGQKYMPLIMPGGSNYNQQVNSDHSATPHGNGLPRLGGQFLWHQAANARAVGADMVEIAMFNEVNEGTAMFKVAAHHSDAPAQAFWLTLDADGLDLPSDWYLKLAYEIGRMYRGETPAGAMPTMPGPPSCGVMRADDTLAVEGTLLSCNGKFGLHLQSDGNLVLYSLTGPTWASQTVGAHAARLVLGADGNLVLVDAANAVLWSTHTAGTAPAQLAVGDDGNVTLVRAGVVLWQTGTTGR
ncbi:hypothetical protein [Luteibacter pinisoli]|nr:hypothetical protein [Luteibacter pinisoli]